VRWLLPAALYVLALGFGIWAVASGGETGVREQAAARGPAPAATPAPSAVREETPDVRGILARNVFDSKTGPLWPPPPSEPVVEEPGPTPPRPPEPGPCEDELRVSGAAYVSPERGRPLVVFSGSDVQRSGARSVGMRVGDKTLIAIYPNVVVLADDDGTQCWVKMYGLHAQEVREKERREEAQVALKRQREEARKNAALRAARRKKHKR
jgi:hypothetical protein